MEAKRSTDLPKPVAKKQKTTPADVGQAVRDMDAPEEVLARGGVNTKKASDSPHGLSERDAAADLVQTETVERQREFVDVWKSNGELITGIFLTVTAMLVWNHRRVVIYNTSTRKAIKEIDIGVNCIWDVSQSRDGKSLFVACEGRIAMIINLDTGEVVILNGHTHDVCCIIQGEGTDVLTCSLDKTIRRWNSSTGECLQVYRGHVDWVNSILYDEATKRIFSASDDKTIIAWNSETGERLGVMEGHGGWVRSLAQVNSTTIASGSADGTIKLWNMATLACIKTISNGRSVYSLAATPDGQYLISGSYTDSVKVWSVANGQCLHVLLCHDDCVMKVTVSPDGRFIATDGHYNTFHVFSVTPPFSFVVHKGVLVHKDREAHLSLFSDGAIRYNGDLIAIVTSTSMCSLVSENRIVIHGSGPIEFTAPSASAAQLWSEAISAVAADLALNPDDRASSADQMIHRHRFGLLQTILVHVRGADCRRHVPREIVQIIGRYSVLK